jgi:hypothetical protein
MDSYPTSANGHHRSYGKYESPRDRDLEPGIHPAGRDIYDPLEAADRNAEGAHSRGPIESIGIGRLMGKRADIERWGSNTVVNQALKLSPCRQPPIVIAT